MLKCNICNIPLLHEGNGKIQEAEYCYRCGKAYCADHMDFSIDDNTCIKCSEGNKNDKVW